MDKSTFLEHLGELVPNDGSYPTVYYANARNIQVATAPDVNRSGVLLAYAPTDPENKTTIMTGSNGGGTKPLAFRTEMYDFGQVGEGQWLTTNEQGIPVSIGSTTLHAEVLDPRP